VRVDRGAGLDQRIHVRDGDQDGHATAGRRRGHRELIEVQGVVIVDRRPKKLAEIAKARTGR